MKCFTGQLRSFSYSRSIEVIEAFSKTRGSTIGVNDAETFLLTREVF